MKSPCECGIEPPDSTSYVGKRHLRRLRRRWEDSNKMDLGEIGINTRNLVDSAQDRNYW